MTTKRREMTRQDVLNYPDRAAEEFGLNPQELEEFIKETAAELEDEKIMSRSECMIMNRFWLWLARLAVGRVNRSERSDPMLNWRPLVVERRGAEERKRMKRFRLHWRDGTVNEVQGADIADAICRAGWGQGVFAELDHWKDLSPPTCE